MADESKKERHELRATAQQVFMAGLGALKKAEEEGSRLFQKLAEKGKGYDGPAADQLQNARHELVSRLGTLADRAAEGVRAAPAQAQKARAAAGEQVGRARDGMGTAAAALERQVQKAVESVGHGLGLASRSELEAVRESLSRLTRSVDGMLGAEAIEARKVGGGWHEIRVGGLVVDRIRGEDAARARVDAIRRQNLGETGPGEISVEPTGGGWYEVRLDGVAMDKVQGRRAAEAAIERIKKQMGKGEGPGAKGEGGNRKAK